MAGIVQLPAVVIFSAEGTGDTAHKIEDVGKVIGKVKTKTDGAAHATTNYFLALQAATSGLNQLSGGLNKVIGGLEATGVASAEQARQMQVAVRQFELLTGAAEVGIAMMNIKIAAMEIYTVSTFKATLAAEGLTAAIMKQTAAMAANPLVAAILIISAMVAALWLLESRYKALTNITNDARKATEMLGDALRGVADAGAAVGDAITGIGSGKNIFGLGPELIGTEGLA